MARFNAIAFTPEEAIQLKVLQALVALASTLEIHDKQLSDVRNFLELSYLKKHFFLGTLHVFSITKWKTSIFCSKHSSSYSSSITYNVIWQSRYRNEYH